MPFLELGIEHEEHHVKSFDKTPNSVFVKHGLHKQ